MTWKDGQLDHTAWLDMCKEGCHSSRGPTLTILTWGMVTGMKTRQKHSPSALGSCALLTPVTVLVPLLSHPNLTHPASRKVTVGFALKSLYWSRFWSSWNLPLWRAMGRALGQRGFTWGLSRRQGCGPQWGVTQRSPETRNKGSESVHGEVAPLSPTPPPDASVTVWFESARSDSAHWLRACYLYSHTEFIELLSRDFPLGLG